MKALAEPRDGEQTASTPDNPGVIARPPRIYLATLIAGLGLDALWPAPVLELPWQYGLGAAAALAGVIIMTLAMARFRIAGTNVPTNLPATALATGGIYRLTRNPIYVAMTLIYLGIAIAIDSPVIALLLVPVLLVMRYGVIGREERYLEANFGDAYRAYKARARRWI